MSRLIILLVLLSYSCTIDKSKKNIQNANSETTPHSNYSNPLPSILTTKEFVVNQETQSIYNSVIKGIRPNMSKDSLNKVLQTIHYWDQIYRDSLNTKNLDGKESDRYWEQISSLDKMNQRVVLFLLKNIGGWPHTKDMSEDSSMAIWLVIHHNSDTKEFSQQILPYLNKAYFSDKLIDNKMYAGLFDEVNYTVNGYSKYGTFGYDKEFYHDSVRTRINLERTAIGLAKL